MNLNAFMEQGISGVLKTAARFYLSSGKGRAFLAGILPAIKKSAKLRDENEKDGMHVPPFLIASVASQCNLRCAGCYARAGGGCGDSDAGGDLSAAEWEAVFADASGLGVSFILLAGGEPLTRPDVMRAAAGFPHMIFPVFTNGTMLQDEYLRLFDARRNLVPVISLEGGADDTDRRRGGGVYAKAVAAMARLREKNILFGVSVTITRANLHAAVSEAFVAELRGKGCGLIFFVEYVPAEEGTEDLVLRAQEARVLEETVAALKKNFGDVIILSFPGDEAAMGGCLASGRGFFHINARGGAEPCPFSPFSRHNLKTDSMAEVLRSDFFRAMRGIAADAGPQRGGCTLFDRKEDVRAFLGNS